MMNLSILEKVLVATLLLGGTTTSRGAAVEEIVVTASMKEEGYNEMPAITLRHKAVCEVCRGGVGIGERTDCKIARVHR
jgi:hypothetical protein